MTRKKHTARYLLDKFLDSDHSFTLHLNTYDISALHIITKYLDLPGGKCFGKQSTLAKQARMSRFEFMRVTEKLVKLNILFRYMKGKLYYYELGSLVLEMS